MATATVKRVPRSTESNSKSEENDSSMTKVVHEHRSKSSPNLKRTAVFAGALAIASGALGFLFNSPSGSYSTSVGSGEVVKIVPQTFDIRALVVSGIKTTGTYRSTNLAGQLVNAIGLGGCFEQQDRFKGQVDSYVYAKSTGVKDIVNGNKQTIVIPSKDIGLLSSIDVANSLMAANNGFCHNAGALELKAINNNQSNRIEDSQGYLGRVTQEAALNYAQTSCVQKVWPDTFKAVTYAYEK